MAGRPDPDPRQLAAVLPRHGPAVGEQRGQHQEQVVLGHRRGRRPGRRRRRRDHRPGRPLRRLGGLRQGRQGQVRLQRARHPGVRHRGRRRRSRPAPTRCGWSSPTTAAGWPRAATSPCTTTATPVGTGRVEATQPMIFSADETTDIGYESGTTVTPDYTAREQPVHRQDPLGADRRRRRRPRPLHRPRGAPPHRHGPAVATRPCCERTPRWRRRRTRLLASPMHNSPRCSRCPAPTASSSSSRSPTADQRATIQALGLDPLDAQIRQVYFFDTPDLALNSRCRRPRPARAGRGRRHGGQAAAGRPRPSSRPSCARRRASASRSTRCRAASSARPRSRACSTPASVTRSLVASGRSQAVHQGAAGASTPRTRRRASLSTICAVLGPIFVLKLKGRPRATTAAGRRAVALPRRFADPRALDQVPAGEAFQVAAETRAFLGEPASTSPASSRPRRGPRWSSSRQSLQTAEDSSTVGMTSRACRVRCCAEWPPKEETMRGTGRAMFAAILLLIVVRLTSLVMGFVLHSVDVLSTISVVGAAGPQHHGLGPGRPRPDPAHRRALADRRQRVRAVHRDRRREPRCDPAPCCHRRRLPAVVTGHLLLVHLSSCTASSSSERTCERGPSSEYGRPPGGRSVLGLRLYPVCSSRGSPRASRSWSPPGSCPASASTASGARCSSRRSWRR